MTVTIREARPDDAAAMLAYLDVLSREPGLDIPLGPGEFTLTEEQERDFIARCAAQENALFLVAVAEGQIVGALVCTGRADRQALRHSVTLGISVRDGWRNQGLGTRMMEQAIAWARNSGVVKRIELDVYARNKRAIHVYEKLGFVQEGHRRRAIFQQGEYIDNLLMALLLDE